MHNGKKIPDPRAPALHILLLEDSAADAMLIEETLRESGLEFTFESVGTRSAFEQRLAHTRPHVILSDYSLADFDGRTALEIAQRAAPEIPFIFVTGVLGEEMAIDLLKLGATDYVLKFHLSRLVPAVRRALREARERAERERAEKRLQRSNEQLRALTSHLQHVREEERTRIAREVHDELGQALTGLKLDLSWLASRLRGSSRPLVRKLKSMSDHIDTTILTVRRIATELRPALLDTLGLGAAVEWQAGEFQERTGIDCEVFVALGSTELDPEVSTVCFRIFQETLTNIIRHAQATRVQVRLVKVGGQIVLSVRDNGRGFTDREYNSRGSLGLTGMRERVAQVGGEIAFDSAPGAGTSVTTRLPLHPVPAPALAP